MDRTEYLRRNLLHAGSIGANANLDAIIVRLRSTNYAPAWLLDALDGVKWRIEDLPAELAMWRDQA